MVLARRVLWFYLVMSVVFGGIYLFAPELMTRPMGIEPVAPEGFTDLRASYGGFQLGMAGFLGWCLRDPARIGAGLTAFAFLVAALAACRLFGLLVDGFTPTMTAATTFEAGLTAFTLFVRGRLGAQMASS